MKKINKISTLLCVLILTCIIASACAIGTVNITYYDKQGNILRTEQYGIQQRLTYLPQAPQIFGYQFKGWGRLENSESVVDMPYEAQDKALYAKYTLLESWFNSSEHTKVYYGEDLFWRVSPHGRNTYEILIENIMIPNANISYVAIIGEAGGSFSIRNLRVMDQYANELTDDNAALDIWEPKSSVNNIEKYVLSIEIVSNGAFYIDVR